MIDQPPRFYFDYMDPLSLMLEREIAALEGQGVPSVRRYGWELRPPPARLMSTDDPLWLGRWEEAERLARTGGVTMKMPTLLPWTRKAHELAMHARAKDRFREVHEALFRAFLEEGRDIGRVDVLVGLAADVGLDPGEAKAVLDVDRYTAEIDGIRGDAERLGVRGVPTLLIAGERIEGVLPSEALKALLGEI
jgi:predicted DsbA family dithiol-disulfide isomerase